MHAQHGDRLGQVGRGAVGEARRVQLGHREEEQREERRRVHRRAAQQREQHRLERGVRPAAAVRHERGSREWRRR